ncbi:hypothetical protein DPMN_177216 [Dreissena polymorpha]|uniref:Uncharacterized protein n=1 Tax=Dreissena polymorpha TaxID=45954 RepID=A0A9D4EAU2_DREPO|nr:hypothetical protein DPMN_177216 [Dreissena polymorpha]
MVSINIPNLFPPEQNALIHIITICEEERARSLSLSQKQIKARENCLPKKESVEPDIVLPPLFYYIKLQNYSDPCNTIKHLTISNSTTERAHGNRSSARDVKQGCSVSVLYTGHLKEPGAPLESGRPLFNSGQNIIETNVLNKFHEHWTINMVSRVFT